jgi:outer membrane lipoprotein SlyB
MYFKKFLNEVGELKEKDTTKILSESTKGALVGAGIGGVMGLLIGIAKKKNIMFTTMLGAVLGAGMSRAISFKKNKKK